MTVETNILNLNADDGEVIGRIARKLQANLRAQPNNLDENNLLIVERMLAFAAAAEQRLAQQNQRIEYLETLSNTDELTSLLNRRGFNTVLDRSLREAQRYGETGLLIVFDLDGFKAINDTHGHDAGDYFLSNIAGLLRESVRDTDYVARLGGDEFAILLTRSEERGARLRAAEIQQRICDAKLTWNGQDLSVGVSMGVAIYNNRTTAKGLLKTADTEMYREKRKSEIAAA